MAEPPRPTGQAAWAARGAARRPGDGIEAEPEPDPAPGYRQRPGERPPGAAEGRWRTEMQKVMMLIAIMFGFVLAGCQTATTTQSKAPSQVVSVASDQEKNEAILQATKLRRCSNVYLDGLRNFSKSAALRKRMEKVVRRFETLCNITPQNPKEVKSLREKIRQHSRDERYPLVSSTYGAGNISEKTHMQESFFCANKTEKQKNRLQRQKKIALVFANASETLSIKRAGDLLQRKWDEVCAIPRGTQAEKRKFIRNIPDLWKTQGEFSKALLSVMAPSDS